jgi:hypothetical protein
MREPHLANETLTSLINNVCSLNNNITNNKKMIFDTSSLNVEKILNRSYDINVYKERNYNEDIDIDSLKVVVDNIDILQNQIGLNFDKKTNERMDWTGTKTVIVEYYERLKRYKTVHYSPVSKSIKGRHFSDETSLQGIPRPIRHLICKNRYIDIDMKNCHPFILLSLCYAYNIDCEHILYYIENRDICLETLMNFTNKSKDEVKQIVLSLTNGGHDEMFHIYGLVIPDDCKWIEKYKAQCRLIQKEFSTHRDFKYHYNNVVKHHGVKVFNLYGKVLNKILCEYENILIQHAIHFCELNNHVVGSNQFDGLLLQVSDSLNINTFIPKLQHYVQQETGIPIIFVVKDMDEAIDLSKITQISQNNVIKLNDKYVSDSIFESGTYDIKYNGIVMETNKKASIVKAGLGRGKTTACISHINKHGSEYKKIIIYTPRITYAKSIINRLNNESIYNDWVLYNDKALDFYIDKPHVIIQCQSLYRCIDISFDNCLIIVDEIESFLTQLTAINTHKQHEDTINSFEMFLFCKKVICLDAFITDKTLNIFKSLKIEYDYYHYTMQLKQRQFISIKSSKNKDVFYDWMKYIVNELKNNKRMYVFISSLKKLEEFKSYIDSNLPDIKYLHYSSKNKASLDNVNELWSLQDLIMTTSTITVGVNFDIPDHFHSIGIFASASSKNLVRDIFQSSYRVRHLIDDLMIFALDPGHYGVNLPVSVSDITKNIDKLVQFNIELYEKIHNKKHPSTTSYGWLRQLFIDNIHESNNSIMNLESVFYHYLNECNYVESDIMNDLDYIEELDDTQLKDSLIKYSDIPVINATEMKELRKKNIKTDIEKLSIEKFFFQQSVQNIDCFELERFCWSLYSDYGRNKFRNLQHEKGLVTKTLNMASVVDSTLPIIAKKIGIQLDVIKDLNSWFNLEHSQDTNTIITHEKLETLIPLFKDNVSKIYSAFELRETRSKNNEWTVRKITTITNSVLDKWGYTRIKKGSRKREGYNGKKDVSNYSLVDNIGTLNNHIYDFIRPKTVEVFEKHKFLLKK